MSAKHTAGPWWISGQGTIRAGEVFWAARCNWKNREANARLIAAAPDLLAALEFSVPLVQDARDRFARAGDAVCASALTAALLDITAAIAKARGT